ncbi:iron complex outermembrane recepter protein [Chryseobacterium soldanellicola]|uniref:Iron complex outermembrane recepter protein n=1 Tax=Chryseobacterium soldanellicola TaxID=311333 RepID=A0A1H1CWJ8_9FLAO|nr:SusC/RagA family TonB-linked outer membrane protein [Chryseobacterium soldanellicola]SDQ68520.1 iron complex outermembrane recepter protein [Chryseobacterium soldanellicola]
MKLNAKTSFTVGVFCFLFGTTGQIYAQKIKKDSIKTKEIEEVVVTALGIKRDQRKLGYAISKVDSKDVTQAGVVNPMEALQGKLPGVQVIAGSGGPQSSARIQIRGNTSLGKNNQPLIVVDGVVIDNSVTGADEWGSGYDFGNEMKNLNSDVFESVSVLRGAAASALYGSRASNGVIVITTKKGRSRNGIGIKINSSLTTQSVYAGPKLQNEYGAGVGSAFPTDSNGNRFIDPNTFFYSYGPKFDGKPVVDIDGRTVLYNSQPKNYLELYQVGIDRKNSVELSGGNDKSTFLLSFTNQEAEGILPRNKFTKNAYFLRATHEFNKYLQLDTSFNYTRSYGENPVPQGGNSSPLFSFIYGTPRSFDANYWSHNYLDPVNGGIKQGDYDPYGMAGQYFDLFQNTRSQKENNYIGRLEVKSQLTDWLNVIVGGNFNNYNFTNESKILGSDPGFKGGGYSILEGRKEQNTIKFLANANFKLTDNLTMNASIGGESFSSKYKSTRLFTNNGLRIPGIFEIQNSVDAPGYEPVYTDGNVSPKKIQSLYAFANFAWKDQLFLDITGRNDWSSTLAYPDGHGSVSYFYPSFVGNWTFSKSFNFPQSMFGSLRGSLAWVGKDTSPYNTSSGFYYRGDPSAYNSPDGTRIPLIGFNSRTLANANLKNELSRSIELGLNMAFLNNRLDFDVSVYRTNTTNQVLTLPLPQESGEESMQINAGNLQNTGIEIILNAVPIKSNNFKWDTSLTFAKNQDKILELAPGVEEYVLQWAMGRDVKSIAVPGQEYGLIQTNYAFATYQALDANGNKIDDPRNGMRVLKPGGTYMRSDSYQNQGYVTVGKLTPDFLTSFRNTFKYKNIALSVLIDARVGGDILSATYNYGTQFGNLPSTLQYRDEERGGIKYTDANGQVQFGVIPEGVFAQNTQIKDKQGTTRDVGGMTYQEVFERGWINPLRTDLYYRNLGSWGSGIRENAIFENTWVSLRELKLTYSFAPALIKPLGINTLNASLIGRNLFYIYNKLPDGINPEGMYNNNSGSFAEYGGSPMSRYIGFNLDFSF